MLPDHIELEIVTPERHVQTARVVSVEFPGKEGYMGVLPGHAPLLTELGIGTLVYREGAELHYAAVINGYAEVLPGRVIVLADVCAARGRSRCGTRPRRIGTRERRSGQEAIAR